MVRLALPLLSCVVLAAFSILLAALEAAFYLLKRRHLGPVAVANPRAALVNAYLADPPSLLMPVHVGTYLAHVGMTVLLTATLLDWLHHGALLVALGAMILYLFLFRMTLPYAIVRRNPEKALLLLMPIALPYLRAVRPIVRLLRRRAAISPLQPSDEEGRDLGQQSQARRAREEAEERRLADAVDRFSALLVRNIMTPRPDVVAVPEDMAVADVRRRLAETKVSRVPVYRKDLDDIVGVVSVRDLIECGIADNDPVRPLVRPVHMVPETKRVTELLRELQAQRGSLAVVIDEYGGVAGLASIEDIVEELVGEIEDEFDLEGEPIVPDGKGAFRVDGRVSLDRLQAVFGTSLCDEDDVETAGGLAVKAFGRIPRPGERVEQAGFTIEVLEADRRRVSRVRFTRLPPPAQEEA